jgi:hypothetical protein
MWNVKKYEALHVVSQIIFIITNECTINITKVYITTVQWRTQEFCLGGGGSKTPFGDRGQIEQGSGGGSPLVRGSGGSCNFIQEISFHIVKFS